MSTVAPPIDLAEFGLDRTGSETSGTPSSRPQSDGAPDVSTPARDAAETGAAAGSSPETVPNGAGQFGAELGAALQDQSAAEDLQRTARNAPQSEAGIEKAANQFEEFFLSQMLKKMYDAIPKSGLYEKAAGHETYMEMFHERVARTLADAEPGIGLQEVLEDSIRRKREAMGLEDTTDSEPQGRGVEEYARRDRAPQSEGAGQLGAPSERAVDRGGDRVDFSRSQVDDVLTGDPAKHKRAMERYNSVQESIKPPRTPADNQSGLEDSGPE